MEPTRPRVRFLIDIEGDPRDVGAAVGDVMELIGAFGPGPREKALERRGSKEREVRVRD